MNKDYYELNDELESQKEAILEEANDAELNAQLDAYDDAMLSDFLCTEEDRKREELEEEIEQHPERFVERSACCNAEVYDDAEFCVECLKREPDIIYKRIDSSH